MYGQQRRDGERRDQRGGRRTSETRGAGQDAGGDPVVAHDGVAGPGCEGDVEGLRVARPLHAGSGPHGPEAGCREPGPPSADPCGDGVDRQGGDERGGDRDQQAGAEQTQAGTGGDQPHQGGVQREERRGVALDGDQAARPGYRDERGVVAVRGDLLVPPAVPGGQDVPDVGAAAEAGVLLAEVSGGVQQVHEDAEADELQRTVQREHRTVLLGRPAQARPPPAGGRGEGGGEGDGAGGTPVVYGGSVAGERPSAWSPFPSYDGAFARLGSFIGARLLFRCRGRRR